MKFAEARLLTSLRTDMIAFIALLLGTRNIIIKKTHTIDIYKPDLLQIQT